MNWHDGLVLTWQLHSCGFKPWEIAPFKRQN